MSIVSLCQTCNLLSIKMFAIKRNCLSLALSPCILNRFHGVMISVSMFSPFPLYWCGAISNTPFQFLWKYHFIYWHRITRITFVRADRIIWPLALTDTTCVRINQILSNEIHFNSSRNAWVVQRNIVFLLVFWTAMSVSVMIQLEAVKRCF